MTEPAKPSIWERSLVRRFFRWLFSWRGIRRILIVSLWIVTLIALVYAEENWRGRHIWNKTRAQLEARGEQLDLKAFIPKPVPDEQNFGATPFIKNWFERRQDDPWRDDYSRVKHPPKRSEGKAPRRITDLSGWAIALEEARSGERRGDKESKDVSIGALDKSSRAKAAPLVLEWMKSSEESLAELRAASQRPYARYPVVYNLENPWGILLPHLARAKAACQRLQLRACAELAAGQSQKALDDVNLILYLADSMKEEPFLISYLVRIACLQIAIQPIWEGLAEHRWADAELAALSTRLQRYNLIADTKPPLDSERAAGILTADLLYRQKYHLSDLLGEQTDATFSSALADLFARIAPHGWYYQEQHNYCRLFELQRAGTVDGPKRRVFPEQIAAQGKALEREVSGGRLGRTLYGVLHHQILSGFLLPALENVPRRASMAQTATDQAAMACALERHRLANGQFPENLKGLAPRFVSQLPNDPITGESYAYRREGGGFVLYSVGWNQKDDGGAPGKELFDQKSGDWVWDYPEK